MVEGECGEFGQIASANNLSPLLQLRIRLFSQSAGRKKINRCQCNKSNGECAHEL